MIRDRAFYRSILRLSLPAAFQALMSLLVVMADNVMVTRLDPVGYSLAAVSQSNSITNFVFAATSGLAGGAIVLISQYWGKKDLERIRQVYATVMAACLGLALLFIVLILLFPGAVLSLVISAKEGEVTRLAREYLPIVCLSYLPFSITAAMIGVLKGVEVVRITLYTTLASLVANISLNYLLIFGHLGFPALGVRGAAIATLLARVLEMGLVLHYMFHVQKALAIRPRDLLRQRRWAWQDYRRYGLPVGMTDAQWALVGMLKMIIIGQMGRLMINAAAVTDTLLNLGTLFTFALSGGAAVLVGKAVGAGDYKLVREYAKTIQIMFLGVGIVMAAAVFFLRTPFIALYRMDGETAALAATMAAICAPTLLGTSYHASCFVGINRGAGDSRFVMLVDMICGWLVVLPAAALSAFVLHLPLQWIYFSTRIDQCFKWLIAFLRLRGDKWVHNVTRDDGA
ncbi:MAG: MATE family efflux transporter [Christensenellales bacterium]